MLWVWPNMLNNKVGQKQQKRVNSIGEGSKNNIYLAVKSTVVQPLRGKELELIRWMSCAKQQGCAFFIFVLLLCAVAFL